MPIARATVVIVLLASWANVCAAAVVSPDTIAALAKTASGDDPISSLAALRQLAEAGDAGMASLRQIVPQLFARDSAAVVAAADSAAVAIPRLRAMENQMQPLQSSALQMIDNLTEEPESLKSARRSYAKLDALEARLSPEYARLARVAAAVARKDECAKLRLSPASSKGDEALQTPATKALSMPAAAAVKYLAGSLEPPVEADRRGLWLYLAARRIDAWNKSIEPSMNSGEIAHARKVNAYREMLGLLPLELDARLIQSARGHSKEMIDLWYFSHWSPTPSLRSPFGRMAQAGYALGSNENITMGPYAADDSFWNLFNSPDHHRAWVLPQNNSFGVGKWENAWTEDIGAGPRLMIASTEEREAAVVRGNELKPQTQVVHNRPRDLSDIKIYDKSGQEVGSGKNGAR